MNKQDLVDAIASETNVTKTKDLEVVNAIMETIKTEVEGGGTVSLNNFGTFAKSERAARTGRNPQTGEPLEIPAKTVVKFKPGKGFKEAVDV